MKINNNTKNTVLAEEAEIAKSKWKKAIGLMLRKSLPRNKSFLMVFEKSGKHGIWMFGMRFEIDLVFLDSKKIIISFYENIKPFSLDRKTWRVYYPKKPARYILELPAGKIRETKTKVGDELELMNNKSE